ASFILRETGANLRRHRLAALASVTTTAFCLLIFGGFVLTAMMLERFSAGLLNQTSIVAYVDPDLSERRSRRLLKRVEAIPGVKSVAFVNRDRAWEEEKRKYNHLPELETMENPLGDELRITVAKTEEGKRIAKRIDGFRGIEKVNEGGVVVDRLVLLNRAIKAVGTAVSGVLLLATVLIIGNAIRLGVFSRRREIRIMKLVGATDGFIRVPFLLEGLLHGTAGAMLACITLGLTARAFGQFVTQSLPFLPLSTQGLRMEMLYASLFAAGGALGLIGSYLSVRRFLRATEMKRGNIPPPPALRPLALGLALLLGGGLIAHAPVYGGSPRSKRAVLNSRLHSLREDQQETREQLRETKGQQRDTVEELHQIQDALAVTDQWIESAERRLGRIEAELSETRDRVREARERLEANKQRLARRIVAARRSGDTGYLSVALGARDFQDFLQREEFVTRIVRADVSLIQSVRDRLAEIEAAEAKIERRKADQEAMQAALAQKREEQRQEYARQKAVYDRLQEERAELEAVYAQLEHDSESVRTMLESLALTPEGQARAAVAWTGSFVRPVGGRLTSGYGGRFHPVLHVWKLHTGVDFGVPTGTPIRAAAAGVVVHAGWLGAYGNAVILDHSGGVSTLYGHCSSVNVAVGRNVSAGEVIAQSGSTGYSTGPHLHFEKRVNGEPVAPF
ncbi:MAG: permease-like cell division protein FtsX, partial [Armatimonadetes bacterium]|nr:permease-like cell division protein FtsX [Armatimonadota bacterium]